MNALKVPVGTTSVVGYGSTAIGLVASVLVRAFHGKITNDDAVFYVTVGWTALSFVITQVGRYAQAHQLAKKTIVTVPAPPQNAEPGMAQKSPPGMYSEGDAPPMDVPAETRARSSTGKFVRKKAAIVPGSFGDVEPPNRKE